MFKIKNIAMNSSGMLNQVNFLPKKTFKTNKLKNKSSYKRKFIKIIL